MKPKLLLCLALVLSGGLFNFVNVGQCADEATTNDSAKPELSMSFSQSGTNGFATSKTMKLGTTNMQDIATSVATNYEKFVSSVTNTLQTNFVPAATAAANYLETNYVQALTNSSVVEIGLAGKFLMGLKKEGRLPGMSKDSHGDLSAYIADLSKFKEAKYPFSMKFNVVLTGDSLTNHYTVTHASADTAWQLQRAWRTDTEGNTIVEWPVK